MTTNLKIETDDKRKVILAPAGADNSTLTIELSKPLLAWNNGGAADVNGLYEQDIDIIHKDKLLYYLDN